MYIVCVYFVAFCFSVILAVSCSSSKQKKTKKNIVALTQYSHARIFPHTHFSTSKNFKCRAKIFTFRRIKNSFSPCWRFAPSLPFITRSVVPAAGEKSLSVSSIPTGQQSKHTAGIEGKEDGSVFCASKDSLPFPSHTVVVTGRRRWGHTFDVVLV